MTESLMSCGNADTLRFEGFASQFNGGHPRYTSLLWRGRLELGVFASG